MAAGEDQTQAISVLRFHGVAYLLFLLQLLANAAECLLAPKSINRFAPRCRREPRGRIGGNSFGLPALDGGEERFLEGVFGEFEVAEDPNKGGQDRTVLVTKYPFDRLRGRPSSKLQHG